MLRSCHLSSLRRVCRRLQSARTCTVCCYAKAKKGKQENASAKGKHSAKEAGGRSGPKARVHDNIADAILDSVISIEGTAWYGGIQFIRGHWVGERGVQFQRTGGLHGFYDVNYDAVDEDATDDEDEQQHQEEQRDYNAPHVARATAAARLRMRRFAAAQADNATGPATLGTEVGPPDSDADAALLEAPAARARTTRPRLFPGADEAARSSDANAASNDQGAADPTPPHPPSSSGAPPPRRAAGAAPAAAAAGTDAGAGPAGRRPAAARPTGPVHVLWDLDNKYPLVLDHARVIDNMRSALRKFGEVVEIRAYCNYQTLKHVPELWEAAMEQGVPHPLDPDEPEQLRCPLCGRRCQDEAQLAKHFKQLHQREHQKRMRHNPKVKNYMQSEKYERYQDAVRQAMPKRRGFNLEGILRAAGVTVTPVQMGPQRADVALERDAMELLRKVPATPGPSRPVLCIVSDDHGFEQLLQLFGSRGWSTVVVSNTAFKQADARLEWSRVVDLA